MIPVSAARQGRFDADSRARAERYGVPLSYMLPCLAVDDVVNRSITDPVPFRENLRGGDFRRVLCPDCPDNILCQPRVGIRLSAGTGFRASPARVVIPTAQSFGVFPGPVAVPGGHPALPHCIAHVVGIGTDPQMGGIATWRIVTRMTDKEAGRDWTYRQFVGQSMCLRSARGGIHLPVTIVLLSPRPRPTRVGASGLVNAGPQSFGIRQSAGGDWNVGANIASAIPPEVVGIAQPKRSFWTPATRNATNGGTIEGKHRRSFPVGRWGLQPRDRQSVLQSNYSTSGGDHGRR